MAILETKGLVKYYGRRKVVDGVSFEVDTGEVVGLLGPNGAGKTTSFRMTTGQLPPNSGRVFFDSKDVTSQPMYLRARHGMGYLDQAESVFRKLNVEQNILAVLEAIPRHRTLGRRPTRKERYQLTGEVLEQLGLTHLRKNNAARLSGGEKRRLEIARCLVCDPLLILLDEPFTGIDPQTIEEIQQIIRELRNRGIGILITDHRVREILTVTDRSYLIKAGQVIVHGSPQQIINNPIAVKEYLGSSFTEGMPSVPSAALPVSESRPAAAPVAPGSSQQMAIPWVLEQEGIRRLIDQLRTPEASQAATQLVQKGPTIIPALLEAMERNDVEIRRLSYEILQHVAGVPTEFDPYAPLMERRQQLATLRERFERKAS